MTAQSTAAAERSLTQEQKDALIAEMLGDVANLHRSVKDLVVVTDDADRRITARVSEIRTLVADLVGMREALLAELVMRSSAEAQRVLRENVGGLHKRVEDAMRHLEQQPDRDARRQWTDRTAIAIVTAAIASVLTLTGSWLLSHVH
jgi:hypothetical protein